MSATICNFNKLNYSTHAFPEFLFIDTSFFIHAFAPLGESEPQFPTYVNQECDKFLTFLKGKSQKSEILLFTSDSVIVEFLYVILKRCVESKSLSEVEFTQHKTQYKQDLKNPVVALLKDHPEIINQHYSILKDYYNRLLTVPVAIVNANNSVTTTSSQVNEQMCDFMNRYQILPADAQHISIALSVGINNIVAIDCDFHRVSEAVIYTCLSPKPRECDICKSAT